MSKLDYEFVCHYKDGSKLLQSFGKLDEHNFGDIAQEKLEIFELKGKGKSYKVNVITGEFNLNGLKVYFDDLPIDADYKLIYFRRIREVFEHTGQETHIKFCLGLQCNDKGKNKQILIFIEEDGSLTISSKK